MLKQMFTKWNKRQNYKWTFRYHRIKEQIKTKTLIEFIIGNYIKVVNFKM